MSTPYLNAMYLAEEAHDGQMYGEKPYMSHLEDVYQIVLHMPDVTMEMMCAAYLHDVVEDTNIELGTIERRFGEVTKFLVHFCTDVPDVSPRALRKHQTNKRNEIYLGVIPKKLIKQAIGVKLADRLANVRECVATDNIRMMDKYLDENTHFKLILQRFYEIRFKENPYKKYWDELDEHFKRHVDRF